VRVTATTFSGGSVAAATGSSVPTAACFVAPPRSLRRSTFYAPGAPRLLSPGVRYAFE
jgi:hypothetical protein